MIDVMIDLETMSTHPEAVIASIGACIFDIETGEISKDTFYQTVDMESCEKRSMKFSASTIKWWLSQSTDVIDALFKNTQPIITALITFDSWFPKGAKLWSHSSFDPVILGSAFRIFDQKVPWKYNATRDIRTLSALTENLGYDVKKVKPEKPHHALSDAIAQAKYCSFLFKAIKNA